MVVIDCERREIQTGAGDGGEKGKKQKAEKHRFLFVDNVRFLSMLGILAVHCAMMVNGLLRPRSPVLLDGVEDFLKFGTIAFFLISGFLLGDRFETVGRLGYLRRRLQKVFLPWVVWFYIEIAYTFAARGVMHGYRLTLSLESLHVVGESISAIATRSAFWFVPNLFLATTVLLIFRRHLRSLWFGALLFAVNLFYVVNIYTNWLPASHTFALFGFISYLWLGACASMHFERIQAALAHVPTWALVSAGLLTGLISLAETQLLIRLHSLDPVNTLRLSNQIFSVAMVLLLMRLPVAVWPRFVDVRRQMFGVYLTQTLVLTATSSVLTRVISMLPKIKQLHGNGGSLLVWMAVTPIIFLVCLGISQALARHRMLGWMVGDLSLHRAQRRETLLISERAQALRMAAMAEERDLSSKALGDPIVV